jgi:hypothetical protein
MLLIKQPVKKYKLLYVTQLDRSEFGTQVLTLKIRPIKPVRYLNFILLTLSSIIE